MQDLISSVMRFSTAMTLFSMQQMQNAMSAMVDPQSALNKFREGLDSVTDALARQMDEPNRSTLNSVTKFGNDLVDRTMETINVRALDPREMAQTTSDLMRRTTDSLTDLMKRATSGGSERPPAGEPRLAADLGR